MHSDDFHKWVDQIPSACVEMDNEGQIVIYTGLMWGQEDNVVPFEEAEDNG